jgi:hypothetical protein
MFAAENRFLHFLLQSSDFRPYNLTSIKFLVEPKK